MTRSSRQACTRPPRRSTLQQQRQLSAASSPLSRLVTLNPIRHQSSRRAGGGWEQGMGAARPPGPVGLGAVDGLAERAVRSGRRIGLVLGCRAGGEHRIVGYGRLRTGAQDTPDGGTIFEIGSITKVFTALLLADLAEHGIVGLDDPLASYLPSSVRVPTGGERQITLGDLASHAGGLPRDPKGTLGRWLGDRHNPYAGLSVQELYAGLARTRLRRRPGERVRYSNLRAGLLGQALAHAAGQPYEDLVRERICRPLDLADTIITPTGEQTARLATGYTRRGRPVPPFQLPALAGAGALRSTATDLLRFLEANLDPAHSPLADQLERIQQPRVGRPGRWGVGLGWSIARPPRPATPQGAVDQPRLTTSVLPAANQARDDPGAGGISAGRSPWKPGLVGVRARLAVALPPQVEVQAQDDPDGQPEQPQTVVDPNEEGGHEQEGEQHGRAHVDAKGGPVDTPKGPRHHPGSSPWVPGDHGMPVVPVRRRDRSRRAR